MSDDGLRWHREVMGRYAQLMRRLPIVGISLALLGGSPTSAADATLLKPPARDITAIAVAEEGDDPLTLFAADRSGGVYRYIFRGSKQMIALSDLEPLIDAGRFAAPSAVAFSPVTNSLFVGDTSAHGVFVCDVHGQEGCRRLADGGRLQEPSKIAVRSRMNDGSRPAKDMIAVADPAANAVFVWPDIDGQPVEVRNDDWHRVDRIRFDDQTLLAYDTDARRLWSIELRSDSSVPALTLLPLGGDATQLPPQDFTTIRGVAYFAGPSGVTVAALTRPELVPMARSQFDALTPAAIEASPDKLLIADFGNGLFTAIDRLVPVTVSCEHQSERVAESLAAVLSFAEKRQQLPWRPARAVASFATLEMFLLSEQLIAPPPRASSAPVPNDWLAPLEALLCSRNPCRDGHIPVPIAEQTTIHVPDIEVNAEAELSSVFLHQESVESALERLVPSEAERQRTDKATLWRVNPAVFDEDELRETILASNFVPVDLRTDAWPVGAVCSPGPCVSAFSVPDSAPKIERSSLNLPFRIHVAARTNLPNVPAAALQSLNVASVEADWGGLTTTALDEKWLAAIRSEASGDAFVISRKLEAKRAAYRFFDKDGRQIAVNQRQLDALKVQGRADGTGEWSVVIEQPFNVGFEAIPAGRNVRIDAWETATTLSGGAAGDFTRKPINARVNLPVAHWKVQLLVSASDVDVMDSPLRAQNFGRLALTGQSAVQFRSQQRSLIRPQSTGACIPEEPSTSTLLKAARKMVVDAIAFDPASFGDIDMQSLAIAVGERGRDLDMSLPFLRGARWLRYSSDLRTFVPVAPADGSTADAEDELVDCIEFDPLSHHATHIASFLSSQEKKMPGLLPAASYYLIDTSNPDQMIDAIDAAIRSGVRIFSFSFEAVSDASLDPLKAALDGWGAALFIVAAGNGNSPLDNVNLAPIGWVPTRKALFLGVAASTLQPPLGFLKPSNWGRRYVQLMAPGCDVYARVDARHFAPATGTSQAVPMVAATAALLSAQSSWGPREIKLRLMYTADEGGVDEKVQSGFLNVRRALFNTEKNVVTLKMQSGQPRRFTIALDDSRLVVFTSGKVEYDQGEDSTVGRLEVRPADILRMTRSGDTTFRVVFIDRHHGQNRFCTIVGAVPSQTSLPCRWMGEINGEPTDGIAAAEHCRNLALNNLLDYVAKVPNAANIQF